MPLFTVIPAAAPIASAGVNVTDPEHVLGVVSNLDCPDADVLRDGQYAFSIHYGGKGMWVLSDRKRKAPSRQGQSGSRLQS